MENRNGQSIWKTGLISLAVGIVLGAGGTLFADRLNTENRLTRIEANQAMTQENLKEVQAEVMRLRYSIEQLRGSIGSRRLE
jgi:uncharacterized membrane-anchored protein YhcB (DUF1043 family)